MNIQNVKMSKFNIVILRAERTEKKNTVFLTFAPESETWTPMWSTLYIYFVKTGKISQPLFDGGDGLYKHPPNCSVHMAKEQHVLHKINRRIYQKKKNVFTGQTAYFSARFAHRFHFTCYFLHDQHDHYKPIAYNSVTLRPGPWLSRGNGFE